MPKITYFVRNVIYYYYIQSLRCNNYAEIRLPFADDPSGNIVHIRRFCILSVVQNIPDID